MGIVITLADRLRSGGTAVFCGAGISLNSGLPVVQHLLDYLFIATAKGLEEIKRKAIIKSVIIN